MRRMIGRNAVNTRDSLQSLLWRATMGGSSWFGAILVEENLFLGDKFLSNSTTGRRDAERGRGRMRISRSAMPIDEYVGDDK